jgi:hypothetical protein
MPTAAAGCTTHMPLPLLPWPGSPPSAGATRLLPPSRQMGVSLGQSLLASQAMMQIVVGGPRNEICLRGGEGRR